MSKKRAQYSNEFKAKVALEAIRGEETVPQLASRYGPSEVRGDRSIFNIIKYRPVPSYAGDTRSCRDRTDALRERSLNELKK